MLPLPPTPVSVSGSASPTMTSTTTLPPAFVPIVPLRPTSHSQPQPPLSARTPPPAFAPHMTATESNRSASLPPQSPSHPGHSPNTNSRDFHGIPNPNPGDKLTLPDLRERLIRQEETIIFSLIERAQFRMNDIIYKQGAFAGLPNYFGPPYTDSPSPKHHMPVSFSQYMLYELERCHSRVRRYTSPDEHPFAPPHILSPPILPQLDYPPTLVPNDVNVNDQIQRIYRSSILPSICDPGDDQNYGSSATCDAACLQALSKRIHYGKFIAEAKCQEHEDRYRRLARSDDRKGIWDLLTNVKVEDIVFKRVENKARNYGSCITDVGPRDVFKVDPVIISNLYRDFIIPLTKDVEVDYILHRYKTEG